MTQCLHAWIVKDYSIWCIQCGAKTDVQHLADDNTQFIKQLAAAQARIAALEAEQRWIPVSERLPDDGITVLACYDNSCNEDFIEVLWHEDGCWWCNPNHSLARDYAIVTHWTPLPSVPGEGEEATHE